MENSQMEPSLTLEAMPTDVLANLTSRLHGLTVIHLKWTSKQLKSKMENGGFTKFNFKFTGRVNSKTWLQPVCHSHLMVLHIILKEKEAPPVEPGTFSALPQTLVKIRFRFARALLWFHINPAIANSNTIHTLPEYYSAVHLDKQMPHLTSLELIDTPLSKDRIAWPITADPDFPHIFSIAKHLASLNIGNNFPNSNTNCSQTALSSDLVMFQPSTAHWVEFVGHLPLGINHLHLQPVPLNASLIINHFTRIFSIYSDHIPSSVPGQTGPAVFNICALRLSHTTNFSTISLSALPYLTDLYLEIPFISPPSFKFPASISKLRFASSTLHSLECFPGSLKHLDLGYLTNPEVIKGANWYCKLHTLKLKFDSLWDFSETPDSLTTFYAEYQNPENSIPKQLYMRTQHFPDSLTSITLNMPIARTELQSIFVSLSQVSRLAIPRCTVHDDQFPFVSKSVKYLECETFQFSTSTACIYVKKQYNALSPSEQRPPHIHVPKSLVLAVQKEFMAPDAVLVYKNCTFDSGIIDLSHLPAANSIILRIVLSDKLLDSLFRLLPPNLGCLEMPFQFVENLKTLSLLPQSLHTVIFGDINSNNKSLLNLPDNIRHMKLVGLKSSQKRRKDGGSVAVPTY